MSTPSLPTLDPTRAGGHAAADARVAHAMRRVLGRDADFQRYGRRTFQSSAILKDYLLAMGEQGQSPHDVFDHLRWGGQYVFASRSAEQVEALAGEYRGRSGFALDHEPGFVRAGLWGLPIPWLGERIHYFIARKVNLVRPGQMTDRFTYQVELVRRSQMASIAHSNRVDEPTGNQSSHDDYVVLKQIPEYGQVMDRLRARFTDVPLDVVAQRARKLVDRVFPIFLTREVAILNILQRDLPPAYRCRIPEVIDIEKDQQGFVRRLYLRWLRNGGRPISQLDFARQGSDLLRALHEQGRVMHLDLRPDNLVITADGVGFVDFGSAVRFDENLSESAMLRSLFDEMMSVSQIQRMLGRMKQAGKLTSQAILDGHQKVHKSVDLFYWALQMNEPHANPDFRDLVRFDPASVEARALSDLTARIMRPHNPEDSPFKNAGDILRGVERVASEIRIQELPVAADNPDAIPSAA